MGMMSLYIFLEEMSGMKSYSLPVTLDPDHRAPVGGLYHISPNVLLLSLLTMCSLAPPSPASKSGKLQVSLDHQGFPGGLAGKESTCNVGDLGSIPGLGTSSVEGKGYPLQYSGLEKSMDCIVHEVTKSQI